MRIFGPTFGYGFAYVILKIYVAPALTPVIANDDPRWLGAWWLGWILFGTVMFMFAILIGLFPRKIRREKSVEEENRLDNDMEEYIENLEEKSTEAKENGDLKGEKFQYNN